MAANVGQCPKCRMANSYSSVNCVECGVRLPWADAAEEAQRKVQAAQQAADHIAQQQAAAQNLQQHAVAAPATTGRFCPKCGKAITGTSNYCARCGKSLNAFNDESSFGHAALGFLIPIVGAVLYFSLQDSSPQKAASAGRGAIAGLIVYLLLGGGTILYSPFGTGGEDAGSPLTTLVQGEPDKEDIAQQVKDGYNAELQKKGVDFTCTSVSLVKESRRKLTGFAELSNGRRPKITATIDPDGSMIWEATPF
jgi:hypothetical protein